MSLRPLAQGGRHCRDPVQSLFGACTVLTWQSKSWKFRVPFCQWKAENTVSFPKCAVNLAHSESSARADSWLSQTKMILTERLWREGGCLRCYCRLHFQR